METIKIELVKRGDFIRRKETSKKTFIRGEYCRFNKAYTCQDFNDISNYIYIKKGKTVFINFDF